MLLKLDKIATKIYGSNETSEVTFFDKYLPVVMHNLRGYDSHLIVTKYRIKQKYWFCHRSTN